MRRMNTLMYPFGPDDDFPGMFCAIRPCSGEQQIYTPEGESVNKLILRMGKEATEMEDAIDILTGSNVVLRVDNSMLRELCGELIDLAKAVKAGSGRLAELERHARNLGVEVYS